MAERLLQAQLGPDYEGPDHEGPDYEGPDHEDQAQLDEDPSRFRGSIWGINWSVRVYPWEPSGEAEIGHDLWSRYFEIFWLAVMGPLAGHLYRKMASGLKANPEGFVMDASLLGDLPRGQDTDPTRLVAKLDNAIGLCTSLGLVRQTAHREVRVRCLVPTLPEEHLARLPRPLRMEHRRLEAGELNPNGLEAMRTRARRLAATLLDLGEDPSSITEHLAGWHFHPALIWETQRWACSLAGCSRDDYSVAGCSVAGCSAAGELCPKGGTDEVGLSNSTRSLTPKPVPPLCQSPSSTLDLAGPAMSR
jgi:hypothetical protein